MDEHANDPFIAILRARDLAQEGDVDGALSALVACLGGPDVPPGFMPKFEGYVRLLMRAQEENRPELVLKWEFEEGPAAIHEPNNPNPALPPATIAFQEHWDAMSKHFQWVLQARLRKRAPPSESS